MIPEKFKLMIEVIITGFTAYSVNFEPLRKQVHIMLMFFVAWRCIEGY